MSDTSTAQRATNERPLLVVYQPITSLTPDPRNACTDSKRQVEQIVASMRAVGFTSPILADERGPLIAVHGRLLAAKELGLAEVPVITIVALSEAQQKALRLADNKIALNAGWDVEILKLELADLSLPEFDMDLSLTGFACAEIDVILADSSDPEDEVIPAVLTSPRTQPGDIWQLGEHRVRSGDGRNVAFLQAIIARAGRSMRRSSIRPTT